MNKIIIGFMLIAFLFFGMLMDSYSHEYRHSTKTVIEKHVSRGTALGIATGNHHFDMGTYEWQGSAATGHFQGSQAFSFSVGKRYKDILINGSIGIEDGKSGFGAGATWRFK